MEFAENLIKLRKQKQWTQAYAAREIGIQQSYLSKLENAKFIPSRDVISQISRAYGVAETDLSDYIPCAKNKTNTSYYAACISLFAALVLFMSGFLNLFYAQTFYTYQFSLPLSTKNLPSNGYHVSEQYRGERYIELMAQTKVEYQLIGQRTISRKENNWFYALSCIFFFLAVLLWLKERSRE